MINQDNCLKVNVNCTKILDESFEPSFSNQDKNVYNIVEDYKRTNNIVRTQGYSFPILINLDNQTSTDLENIKIEIITKITASSSNKVTIEHQLPIEFGYSYILKNKEYWNGLLFDMSGFAQVAITLGKVEYQINNKNESGNVATNTPLLINTNDLTNPYHGYRNQQEVQNYLLLNNYIQNSFSARGLLIKFMFKILDELTKNKSFKFEEEIFSFGPEEIPVIQGMLQIDIIAKIMMYIEDLVILLEGVRE